uniref:F-box domain-containing protein n=1 Tax=Araucaria cunninghamii TaxID=56994 RepID=A0A0D6R4X2_ARACU
MATGRSNSNNCHSGGLRRLMKACWTPPRSVSQQRSHGIGQEGGEGEGEEEANDEETAPFISLLPDDVFVECLARLPRSSLQASMMVCHRWHDLLNSNEYYDLRRKIGKLESMLYVLGGGGGGLASAVYSKQCKVWKAGLLFSTRTINISTNAWLLDYHTSHNSLLYAQPAVLDNKMFIIGAGLMAGPNSGGGGALNCTLIYDTWTKSLVRRSPMMCPRKKFACCVISSRIYVAGGSLRRGSCSTREAIVNAEEYVPELDLWRPISNMPRKRYGCLGAAVEGIFYVIGGLKFGKKNGFSVQPYAYVSSMDSYDPKTNTWLKTKPLPVGGCVIACSVMGSCIYMLCSHAVELSLWKYDTRKDSYTRIKSPPIPSPLRMDNVIKFCCVTMGTCIYIVQVGGSIDDLLRRSGRCARGQKEGLVLIYDTKLQEWSRGPDLPFVRNGATCAVVDC